ncbi:hypothetical protein GCK32_022750 [Trichostrongylus colubriformis]|uniref:Uncharacterized protein n=1 Tax=Trichostrongylus colubriformis TaxID=6319 RepID=A0AAN8EWS9_TRICO
MRIILMQWQMISNMQSTAEIAENALQQETKVLARNMAELLRLMKNTRKSFQYRSNSTGDGRVICRRKSFQKEIGNYVKEAEVKEDMLDLDIEEDGLALRADTEDPLHEEKTQVHDNEASEASSYLEKRRREILTQFEGLDSMLKANGRVPTRCITYVDVMRREEMHLRCSFCDEKGRHYSDSFPRYKDVE